MELKERRSMDNTANISSSSSTKMLIAMVGIGVICGLLIVSTYEGTLPRVKRLKAEALQQAVFNVVPGVESTKSFAWNGTGFEEAAETSTEVVYAGYDVNGQFKGVALNGAGQGYADIISILYGYDPYNQHVVGFYVLETKETPGLGDKIEKDETFLSNFDALDVSLNEKGALNNEIAYTKSGEKTNAWEVDGITGATISSKAIANILKESTAIWVPRIYANIQFFEENK